MRIHGLVLLTLLAACGSDRASPPPDPAKMTDDQILAAGVQVMLDMSEISAATTGDCDRAARELGAFVDRNAALIAAFQRVAADPARREAIVAEHADDLARIRERSVGLEDSCRDHAGLAAVFARLAGPKSVTPSP